jgi:hypothetical protein
MTDNRKSLIEYRLTQAKDSLKDILEIRPMAAEFVANAETLLFGE